MTPNTAKDEQAADPANFPIVGVGASAGGLAPTVELVRELGAEPGIGVVVIHHLDPTHESGLVEILARATTMPVALASDGDPVEPNHVYVVPPNAGLLLDHGILQVVPRREEGGRHLPIDRFFESLALDRDVLAIAVVLSGTGADGTEGVKTIKREGGITLAQDEGAAYESMPRSAIASGCVDLAASPVRIAQELRRIGAHTAARPSSQVRPPEADYSSILASMRRSSGVDFEHYKHSTIRRRIQRRVFLRGLTELADYAELVQRDPEELRKLCEEVLIHVTKFFREPEAFAALRTSVLPRLCENRPRDAPLRVWVPGCSAGEEVYSIAICLLEFLGETRQDARIKIFGTDLSLAIIGAARAGRYPDSIDQDVSPERLQRFFTKEEGGYRIRREVRDMCVFAKHDVTSDPPFSAMDLVSCRNLMIYLGTELQDRVLALLHYALKEPGFLTLGSVESIRGFSGFTPVDAKHRIYERTSAAARLAFDFTTPNLGIEPLVGPLLDRPFGAGSSGPTDIYREADRLVLAEFAPPGVVITNELAIIQFRGRTAEFLQPTSGAASLDLFRMAREELRLPLRRAIDQARSTQAIVRETISLEGQPRTLEVIPFAVHSSQQRFFLVLFNSSAQPPATSLPPHGPAPESDERRDLASTRQYLESVIEQLEASNEELRASNEEVVSSNEELRSTNEEIQSAKEEIQATNEELRTVNDELNDRNVEATRLSNDLTNVLNSVEIPIMIVARDSRLRRFTPSAGKLFGLVGADLDRPLSEAKYLTAAAPALPELLLKVIEHLTPADCTIQDGNGHWHRLHIRPYVTADGHIDGAVIAARDVDAETRAAERELAARKYSEDIVQTMREGLAVLDREHRIQSTNPAFQQMFGLAAAAIEGHRFDELGRPELATQALCNALARLTEDNPVEDFHIDPVEGESPSSRSFLLDARKIEGAELFLVALSDVTELERARTQRAELGFREALSSAAEGVIMVDPGGRILFANAAAAKLFGYSVSELSGVSVDRLLPSHLAVSHAQHRADYLADASPRAMGTDRDLVGRHKDDTEFPIEVSLSSMGHRSAPIVVAFVTDVSERRRAEREIRAYQDRLQRMAFDATITEGRERRRLAGELHDGVVQGLALAKIKLSPLRSALTGEAQMAVKVAIELLDESIEHSRTLVFELSPPVLYDLGLKQALDWLSEDIAKRHAIAVEVRDDGALKPLSDTCKGVLFRAVRELLINVLKHAHTTSARVSLSRVDYDIQIDVQDRGVGFDPDKITRTSPERFGLLSVREQINALGGRMRVQSGLGMGTLIRVRVPLQGSTPPPSSVGGGAL